MSVKKVSSISAFLLTLSASAVALALDEQEWHATPEKYKNSYQCLNIDPNQKRNLRYIIVDYTKNTSVPCKVVYQKPTEGRPDKTLWQSANTPGYCEQKATGLAEKLEGFGWSCTLPEGQIAYKQTDDSSQTAQANSVSSDDFNLPTITFDVKDGEAIAGQSFDLVVEVTDDVGVKNVQFYHKSADSGYIALPMDRQQESDRYQLTLGEDITTSESLKFYILAEDVSDNTALFGNSISPRTLKFAKAIAPELDTDLDKASPDNLDTAIANDTKSSLISNANFEAKPSSEQSLWQRAVSSNDILGYESYIKFYPYGNYTAMARARLDYLRKRAKEQTTDNTPASSTVPANSTTTPSSLW